MPIITRKEFMQGALGTLLASTASAQARTARRWDKKPNLLFVIADEWRAQAFGYAGDPNAHTPAIDKFASESVNFKNAVAGLPVCSASRACMITGQYPLTEGVFINDVPLKPKDVTLGEAFRKAGYDTGYIGKWHLYGSPDGHFGRRLAYIPPDRRYGFEYWKVCECTHDYNHSLYYSGDDATPKFWPGYDAIAQTKDACSYIRKFQNTGQPFCLFLSWGPPHFPYAGAPKPYQDMFRDREFQLRPNVPEADKQKAIHDIRGYYAHGAALNDCFQSLLDTLEETGMADDTIVVFTSDHGDMMYSQGLIHKLVPWDESIRVPLLIRYPKKFGRKGIVSQAMINRPDLMPTLLQLCDIDIPKGIQGTDFSPSIKNPEFNEKHKSAFLCLPVPMSDARKEGIGAYRGVRTDRYTYVRSLHGPWLLYDDQKDPYQMHNLCGREEMKEVQQELNAELERWLQKLNDKFLPAQDYVRQYKLSNYHEIYTPIGNRVSPWGDWKSTLTKSVQD